MKIPQIGLGTYCLSGKQCYDSVLAALECGYRHIDTASVYRNECEVGEAIRTFLLKTPGLQRGDLYVTTKISPKDQGYQKASLAIKQSLDLLRLDYIDLMLIHWPGAQNIKTTDVKNSELRGETLVALKEARESGLVRSFGVSNYTANHLTPQVLSSGIVANQIEFHPLVWNNQTREILQICKDNNVQVISYSCLGRGELLRNDKNCAATLSDIAHDIGSTVSQVLILWALAKGCVVIPKTSQIDRMKENMASLNFELGIENVAIIDELCERFGNERFCWDPTHIA